MDKLEKSIVVEVRHASDPVAQRVRAWFERATSGAMLGVLDGSRSVRLPHPEKRDVLLKIKGAGLRGGRVRMGVHLSKGPVAATFDFDGRMREDVASGHDNAPLGGASFQQAATEYNVSKYLSEAGYNVVPCIGYGRIETSDGISWFSLFEWNRNWSSILISEDFSAQQYLAANMEMSKLHLELAVKHRLLGYFGYTRSGDGEFLIKDTHPFRFGSPINQSQLSWVLEVLQSLRIRCSACRFFARAGGVNADDDDLAAIPMRALVPDATGEDFRRFETLVVQPYLRREAGASFDTRALLRALKGTRVGAAALDLCPAEYARFL